MLDDLAEQTGVDLRTASSLKRRRESASLPSACDPQGTALGLAIRPFQTGPLRPSHRAGLEGLYYTGAYTTPGIGMPMCLISGEHTARDIAEDSPFEPRGTARLRRRTDPSPCSISFHTSW